MRPCKYRPERQRIGRISVSAEFYERLKRAAKERGVSMASIVEERINEYLNRKGVN